MTRTTVRVLLISIAALWIAVSWALITGAIEPSARAQSLQTQTCIDDINPCPTPTSSGTPRPSGTGTSRPPGGSPTSASPTSTGQPSSPPGQSGSPSPSSGPTTPPPPSVDSFRTRVTIHYEQGEFFGQVLSRKDRCERARRIVLKHDSRGDDETVGKTKSDRRGGWTIRFRKPRGGYYAIAKKKSFAGRQENQTIVCRRGESKTIRP